MIDSLTITDSFSKTDPLFDSTDGFLLKIDGLFFGSELVTQISFPN